MEPALAIDVVETHAFEGGEAELRGLAEEKGGQVPGGRRPEEASHGRGLEVDVQGDLQHGDNQHGYTSLLVTHQGVCD